MNYKLSTLLLTVSLVVALNDAHSAEPSVEKVDAPIVQRESAAPAAVTPPPATVAKAVPVAVLDRFRSYTGQRTPAGLRELFKAPVLAGVRQQPEVVLTTGAEPLVISVSLPSQGDLAPNIAFSGARLLSNTRVGKDEWYVEALPDAGVQHAEMIILTVSGMVEIPLTVAPALSEGIDLSEAGFTAFLGGKDALQPRIDINGDGQKDYLDVYIFTANYIARKQSPHQEHEVSSEPHVSPPGDNQAAQNDESQPAPDKKQVSPPKDGEDSLQFSSGWGGDKPNSSHLWGR